MVSFYHKGDSFTFLKSLKLFTLAESLGGYESLAELPYVFFPAFLLGMIVWMICINFAMEFSDVMQSNCPIEISSGILQ